MVTVAEGIQIMTGISTGTVTLARWEKGAIQYNHRTTIGGAKPSAVFSRSFHLNSFTTASFARRKWVKQFRNSDS
jgi:hypothetical protein